jgi:hypothetical protein
MKKSAANTVKPRKKKPAASPKKAKPSNGALPDWIAKYAADPDEVRAFCRRHRLFDAAHATLALAGEIYRPLAVRVSVMGDPEGSNEWLIFDIDVRKTMDELSAARARFHGQWIGVLPVAKLLLIRVIPHIM